MQGVSQSPGSFRCKVRQFPANVLRVEANQMYHRQENVWYGGHLRPARKFALAHKTKPAYEAQKADCVKTQ